MEEVTPALGTLSKKYTPLSFENFLTNNPNAIYSL
jgi:hypothetical protein